MLRPEGLSLDPLHFEEEEVARAGLRYWQLQCDATN